jgi:hypothetical protein
MNNKLVLIGRNFNGKLRLELEACLALDRGQNPRASAHPLHEQLGHRRRLPSVEMLSGTVTRRAPAAGAISCASAAGNSSPSPTSTSVGQRIVTKLGGVCPPHDRPAGARTLPAQHSRAMSRLIFNRIAVTVAVDEQRKQLGTRQRPVSVS